MIGDSWPVDHTWASNNLSDPPYYLDSNYLSIEYREVDANLLLTKQMRSEECQSELIDLECSTPLKLTFQIESTADFYKYIYTVTIIYIYIIVTATIITGTTITTTTTAIIITTATTTTATVTTNSPQWCIG